MAVKPCKECGKTVSSKAGKCPHCGAPVKRSGSSQVVSAIIALFVIGWCASELTPQSGSRPATQSASVAETSAAAKALPVHKMGETVSIGYTSYAVWRARWSNQLSDNEFLNQRADAAWLFLDVTVRNDDREARSIAPFKLVDETGAEHEASSKAWSVEGSIGVLDSLNPGVEKSGRVVFDVPKNHRYKLKVSGGYWSGESALIEIATK